jgi:transposase-like protein
MSSSWPQRTGGYFQRHKVSSDVKAEAASLYMEGLSLAAIGRRFRVSKEAVRQWMNKFEQAFAEKKLSEKKERPVILLDETKVKRNGKIAYVSISLDLARREVVSAKSYRSVGIISTVDTVKLALASCKKDDHPLFIVDHAPWYACAFEWLNLDWMSLTFNIRNYVERWYRTFKDRTKRFYNNFGIRDDSRAIKRVERFVHLFAYWYNRMRPHETLGGKTPYSLS